MATTAVSRMTAAAGGGTRPPARRRRRRSTPSPSSTRPHRRQHRPARTQGGRHGRQRRWVRILTGRMRRHRRTPSTAGTRRRHRPLRPRGHFDAQTTWRTATARGSPPPVGPHHPWSREGQTCRVGHTTATAAGGPTGVPPLSLTDTGGGRAAGRGAVAGRVRPALRPPRQRGRRRGRHPTETTVAASRPIRLPAGTLAAAAHRRTVASGRGHGRRRPLVVGGTPKQPLRPARGTGGAAQTSTLAAWAVGATARCRGGR